MPNRLFSTFKNMYIFYVPLTLILFSNTRELLFFTPSCRVTIQLPSNTLFPEQQRVFLSYFRNVTSEKKIAELWKTLSPSPRNRVLFILTTGTACLPTLFQIEGEVGWQGLNSCEPLGVDSTPAARGKHSSYQKGCQSAPSNLGPQAGLDTTAISISEAKCERSPCYPGQPAVTYLQNAPTQTQLFTGVGLMRAGMWLETFFPQCS